MALYGLKHLFAGRAELQRAGGPATAVGPRSLPLQSRGIGVSRGVNFRIAPDLEELQAPPGCNPPRLGINFSDADSNFGWTSCSSGGAGSDPADGRQA
jgi:hypothetical protein